MPFSLNLIESKFYQPAVKAIQNNRLIPAYISNDAVDLEVTRLFDSRKDPKQIVICTDFTRFDQHFNRHMQDAAFQIETALCPN